MARLIKTSGEEKVISPARTEFTNEELHALIGCKFLAGVKLDDEDFMFVDDTGLVDHRPINQKATEVVRSYRPGYPHCIYGDVIIVNRLESGEE